MRQRLTVSMVGMFLLCVLASLGDGGVGSPDIVAAQTIPVADSIYLPLIRQEAVATPTATATATALATVTGSPTSAPTWTPTFVPTPVSNCDSSYPTVCIPSPPPDKDCKDIPYRRFKVLPPDPHRLDSDHDGIGCELD